MEFAETFFRNYSDGQWISKERERSVTAIEREFNRDRARDQQRAGAVGQCHRARRSKRWGDGSAPGHSSATP